MRKWGVQGGLLLLLWMAAWLAFAQNPTEKSLFYPLRRLLHDDIFQGRSKTQQYYEGWYFKLVSADGTHAFALIPGIAMDERGDRHAFIQLIDGKLNITRYHRFPAESFRYNTKRFEVWIGDNYFSADSLQVDLGEGEFRANLRMEGLHRPESNFFRPGIMGPFRYAPFLETWHGLVSMDHRIQGTMNWQGKEIDMTGGRGYTEKDRGHSFPRSYIWMQSNHFEGEGTSFMLSVATIPWLGHEFTGFLGFFLDEGRPYYFATYTGAKLERVEVGEGQAEVVIRTPSRRLHIQARRQGGGQLSAPQAGQMDRRIVESLDSRIHLRVEDKKGNLLYEGEGAHAGLEMVGDPAELGE